MTDAARFCTHCGAEHADASWPKRCRACGRTTWRNPTPVAVALVPVEGPEGAGLLAIRRDIEPGRGKLALPGGYVDFGESWQQACAREVREETGVVVDPGALRVFDVQSDPGGTVVLIFGLALAQEDLGWPAFAATAETSERVVVRAPTEMAFPLHTRAVEDYFARL